jgi:hypothetical protein
MAMMASAVFEPLLPRLEYDEHSFSRCHADGRTTVGGILRNSYDVTHSVATRVENAMSMMGSGFP